jgi:tRNA-dihydrouridine synthase A
MDNRPRRFCIAPMMGYTDSHARVLMRLLSRNAWLYTEMLTAAAVVHGDTERLLRFDESEHPVALQLGGCEPQLMARACGAAAQFGYDEVNINVGCPSERVRSGSFGAALMADPATVAACLRAMQDCMDVPITVKTRIGIDHQDSYNFLADFTGAVADTGCKTLIVHARKAWLKGLSPKQNREIPPLHYEVVYRLKRDFPDLEIVINGGITRIADAQKHLIEVDGVMLGRAAYHNIFMLAGVDEAIYGDTSYAPTREATVQAYMQHAEQESARGTSTLAIVKPLLALFHGQPRGRHWRRALSGGHVRHTPAPTVICQASLAMEQHHAAA